ncbi:MAG: 1,4-alpha-glucan branching protein domain-containing protein [Planctomycetota bacterium]
MPKGYLLIILHAHLPYVRHPEYDRFLEEQWYFEAITETYLPLIKILDRMREDGVKVKLTLSVSPTLANMLEDPLLQQRYLQHLELCLRLADRELERTRDWPDVNFLANMYRQLFEEARRIFTTRCQRRVALALAELADAGYLELITCAATHAFLPAVQAEPATARTQILTAVHEHQRIFGRKPKGLWLPECGFYPGLDKVLAEAGIRYFFVDSHGLERAEPKPLFGVNAPIYCPSGVAAFGRNADTSQLVWSSKVGYPGDPYYREFHHDIGLDLEQQYLEEFQYAKGVRSHTGIKYYRITGPGTDKRLYDPEQGRRTAQNHAHDFVARCRDQVIRSGSRMPMPAVLVSPYDAELFGHWWFEGPQWLDYVLREVAASGGELALITPGEYLAAYPVQQKAMPSPSSWGRNGYSEHWINPRTEWIFPALHEAANRISQSVNKARQQSLTAVEQRVLRQAGRELLLAQSSDWPFIITNGTASEYAHRRLREHLNRFHNLLSSLESRQVNEEHLAAVEYMDALFPELDYNLFADTDGA